MMMNENQFRNMLDEMLPSDRHYPTPKENVLVIQIRSDFEQMQRDQADDMYFTRDIVENKVIGWFEEYAPEFLVRALENPDIVSGSEEINEALEALGYMKPWSQVDPEALDPDDQERWHDWDNARDAAERHPH